MKKLLIVISLILSATLACASERQVTPGVTEKQVPYRVGQWLPSDQKILNQWVKDLIRETDADAQPLLPVIQEFKNLIESDPELIMLFTQMFEQVPSTPPFRNDPTGKPQIRDYQHMLLLINRIMTKAPEFNETDLVICFINAAST